MTNHHACRDRRDKPGLSGTRPAPQAAVVPGRTGTTPFKGCPAVPPSDAPDMPSTVMVASGSFLWRVACGGAEPRFVKLHS